MQNSIKILIFFSVLFYSASLSSLDNTTLLYDKGVRFMKAGQHDEAIKTFKDVISKSPYYCLGHFGLGRAYMFKKGMIKYAISHLKYSVELDRSFTRGYFHLGIAYLFAKKYTAALYNFELAFRNDESYVEALYNIVILYERLGKWQLSRAWYAKYLESKSRKKG